METWVRDVFTAVRRLDAGAAIVNDSTDCRLGTMPFRGVKSSGIGREDIRFAIEEMTETRVVCLNLRPAHAAPPPLDYRD
ncbi:MAG: aldehyde dehydrogenase family protein [Acidobacteriales bacterium]|nr:aldehyde dehydrogenase family protein [Terriglobales bacterium]